MCGPLLFVLIAAAVVGVVGWVFGEKEKSFGVVNEERERAEAGEGWCPQGKEERDS